MQGRVAALLVVASMAGACASESPVNTVEWQGHLLREVRSVAQLPGALQSSLGVNRPGVDGVADRGQPFNPTDVISDDRVPMRRFLVAGSDGDTWLVAIERGGRGYMVEVFLFTAQEPRAKQRWGLVERTESLREVVRNISRGGGA